MANLSRTFTKLEPGRGGPVGSLLVVGLLFGALLLALGWRNAPSATAAPVGAPAPVAVAQVSGVDLTVEISISTL